MRALAFILFFSGLPMLAGCSSQRKLSHVETREPAAAREDGAVSSLRTRLWNAQKVSPSCPPEIRQHLPSMVVERVHVPPCPERMVSAFAQARAVLRMEEISAMEGLLGSQCRSFLKDTKDSSLVSLLQPQEAALVRPGGRESFSESAPVNEEEIAFRAALRSELAAMRETHEPLGQWIRVNGEFVITEDLLAFLGPLVTSRACRLSDQEVDTSFRTIHSLEELVHTQAEGDPQRARSEALLRGIHKIVERKIQEFFRP